MAKKYAKYDTMTKEQVIDELENLKGTRLGLFWDKEKEPEKVVLDCQNQIPLVTECKEKNIDGAPDSPNHIMIEGDNYHALAVLNYTHKEKIDVIYIDPPYNTGKENEFKYNDKWVVKEDSYRHSKWLSFMEKRLQLAKELLKETGTIFISIDDNEQAQLKLLCDEIFGQENFINIISLKSKVSAGASGGGEDIKIKKNIEYVIVYAKSNQFNGFNDCYRITEFDKYLAYMKLNKKSFKYTSVFLSEGNKEFYKTIKDGRDNNIDIFKHSNVIIKNVKDLAKEENLSEMEIYQKYFEKLITTTNAQTSIRTRVWDATDSDDNFYSAEYVPLSGRNKNTKTILYFKGRKKVLVIFFSNTAYMDENQKIFKKEIYGTFWDGIDYNNLAKEGDVPFANGKKPLQLLNRILEISTNKGGNEVILDFFAGSGTTGHAVMALNKEDGGNRQFIVCTNNENNIATEVCYPRLEKVMKTGYGDVAPLGGNLKYLRADEKDFVKVENIKSVNDDDKKDLTKKAGLMIALKENTLEEIEMTNYYQIFEDLQKTKKTAIYFLENKKYFGELIKKIEKDKVELYIFSYHNIDRQLYGYLPSNINTQDIPEPILTIYKEINLGK